MGLAQQGLIHYFLVDINDSADYFKIGVYGDKDEIESYWMKYSHDVRYLGSRELEQHEKVKGKHTECGVIVSCKWLADKTNTFDDRGFLAPPDRRHHYAQD